MDRFRVIAVLAAAAVLLSNTEAARAQEASDQEIARALAEMLQSARGVIGANQDLINAVEPTEKGLTGDKVLRAAIAAFMAKGNPDPATYSDPRKVRLLEAQISSIAEVIDENQSTINRSDVGFKGFVPAVFARLVNERFAAKIGDEATVKVTAPPTLVRNRKARPDTWELSVIEDQLLQDTWPVGTAIEEITDVEGRSAYRMVMPEYYSDGCMACHGAPAGEIDITGYPKEGGSVGDLGGVISITLFR